MRRLNTSAWLYETDLLAIDRVVCVGLGKRPRQSIEERAREQLEHPTSLRAHRAARILLRSDGAPWDLMRRAAAVLAIEVARSSGGAS